MTQGVQFSIEAINNIINHEINMTSQNLDDLLDHNLLDNDKIKEVSIKRRALKQMLNTFNLLAEEEK